MAVVVAMTTSKAVNADKLTAFERWELPLVDGPAVSTTAAELESIQEQAYKEGYASGQKKAYEEKKREMENVIATFQTVIDAFVDPLKDMDDDVVSQITQLSMAVAKQVVRRELRTEEGEIVAVVREAMNALPASTRKVTLHIHPDDAELIRQAFSLGNASDSDELLWKLSEDPLITRGGCKISAENSRIDATVEGRLNRIINNLLGGERESDE